MRQTRKQQLSWFGVKTVFRAAATGAPVAKDRAFDPKITLVEERIVLFRARDGKHAIQQAEREAHRYARDRHINPYGQPVITRYLGACDCFEIFEPPGHGREVFSTTEVVRRGTKDNHVVKQRIGPHETQGQYLSRRNISNREFSGAVKRDV